VRYFGLQLIEACIQNHKIVKNDIVDISTMKRIVLDIIQQILGNIKIENILKKKSAVIFVELAKRIWPVNWIEMNSQLRQMYDGNLEGREMCLTILKGLAEDIFIYDDEGIKDIINSHICSQKRIEYRIYFNRA
jgi:hypothetical protein